MFYFFLYNIFDNLMIRDQEDRIWFNQELMKDNIKRGESILF